MRLDFNMRNKIKKYSPNALFKATLMSAFIIVFAGNVKSQTLEIGGMAGTSYYVGELNPILPYNQTQLAYGMLARYNLNSRWAVKFNYYRGKVQGSDATGGSVEGRELDFRSNINDFSLVAEFNFWEYYTGSKKNYFAPYLFGGLTYFTFKPYSQSGVALQPLGTEGQQIGFDGRSPYNQFSFAMTFGFGIKYSLSKRLAFAFEWGMRKTLTDYIDDVSTTYYLDGNTINPDIPDQILSDPTKGHDPYMQRGNESTNDWYNFTGVTITYLFDLRSKKKCNSTDWK